MNKEMKFTVAPTLTAPTAAIERVLAKRLQGARVFCRWRDEILGGGKLAAVIVHFPTVFHGGCQ